MSCIKNELKSTIDSRLQRIANVLLLNASFIKNLGLLNGKMGIALFFYHYSIYTKKSVYKDFAKELISEIIQEITTETPVDFANGLTGIGWGIEYLLKKGFVISESEVALTDIDKTIYLTFLKKPLILVNNEDICSYGLYFLSRINEFENEDNLIAIVKKQQLIYLHDDCERMMLEDELFGFEVPKLTINQLNSFVFFLCEVQRIQLYPVKIGKLKRHLPLFIKRKVEDSASTIENYTLKILLKKLYNTISSKDICDDYNKILESLEEKTKNEFKFKGKLEKELNILSWYSLIYPIVYNHYNSFNTLIENAFTEINLQGKWNQRIENLNNGNLGLSNGIAGHGFALLNYATAHYNKT